MPIQTATRWALVGVTLFGLLWAHALGLTAFAPPSNIDWMLDGDWLGHLYGWLFTRHAPWSVPLAQAPDLVAPTGSSAALTDAIPVLAVVSKLLSPLFGERMQLFGVWMVAGVVGNGVVGVLVCRAWLKDVWSLTWAGCVWVMNPIVSARYGHPPFFAFWVLSALVGACVWPVVDARSARRTVAVTLGLGFLGCGTNGYLAVMASGLVGASLLRLALFKRMLPNPEAWLYLALGPAVCLFSLWLFGFISGARSAPVDALAAEGFGQFSADVLAFFNPAAWSRLFGPMPVTGRQLEGYAYLGFGVIVLLALHLVLAARRGVNTRGAAQWLPLAAVMGTMALYALSNHVTVYGKHVADWSAFYARLGPFPSVFRSSGRFVWPLFAWLTLAACVGAARVQTLWIRQGVLLLAALFQVVDFDATRAPIRHPYPPFVPFKDAAWQLMRAGYRHIAIHPIQIQWTCGFDGPLVARLSWEAYRQGLSINSGHVGRAPLGTDCKRHLTPEEMEPTTVYVPYFQEYFGDFERADMACARLDGQRVCVSKKNDTPLLQELVRRGE